MRRVRRSFREWWIAVLLVSLAGLPGCWTEIYETRLQNTRDLYTRLEIRNRLLAKDYWSDGGGIKLRLPSGYAELAAPQPVAPEPAEDGQPPKPPEPPQAKDDPRQPSNLGNLGAPLVFPGLRGAFASDNGYLFVLSNAGITKPEGATDELVPMKGQDPLKFNEDIFALFVEAAPDLSDRSFEKDCKEVTKPSSPVKFVKQIPYKMMSFNYAVQRENQVVTWVVGLYFYKQGSNSEVQVAVITFDRESAQEATAQALDLSLETLQAGLATGGIGSGM